MRAKRAPKMMDYSQSNSSVNCAIRLPVSYLPMITKQFSLPKSDVTCNTLQHNKFNIVYEDEMGECCCDHDLHHSTMMYCKVFLFCLFPNIHGCCRLAKSSQNSGSWILTMLGQTSCQLCAILSLLSKLCNQSSGQWQFWQIFVEDSRSFRFLNQNER